MESCEMAMQGFIGQGYAFRADSPPMRLRQDFVDCCSAAAYLERATVWGEVLFLDVEAYCFRDRRIEVRDRNTVFCNRAAVLIRCSIHLTTPDACPSQDTREHAWMVIATRVLVDLGRPAKFGRQNN